MVTHGDTECRPLIRGIGHRHKLLILLDFLEPPDLDTQREGGIPIGTEIGHQYGHLGSPDLRPELQMFTLRGFVMTQIVFGWLLSAIFLAEVIGLIRRDLLQRQTAEALAERIELPQLWTEQEQAVGIS